MTRTDSRRVLIGIGNPDRGDDAAGRAAARSIRMLQPEDLDVVEEEGEASRLIARLAAATDAILIDACCSGGQPGAVHRFDVHDGPLPANCAAVTTHGFGLPAALELARVLGQLPPRCIVYAIEGCRFDAGAGLSAVVQRAMPRLIECVVEEIGVNRRK